VGAAHREGSIELSFGAGLLVMDREMNANAAVSQGIGDAPPPARFGYGAVARLGYNLSEKLGISAGTAIGAANGASVLSPFMAATYTADLNRRMSPFVTAGFGMTRLSGDNDSSVTASYGVHAGVGVRSMLGERMALRVEGRYAYEHFKEWGGYNAFNGTATLGLSYFMGGGPPRDTDADGVPDKRDRCASTPTGATVDLRGCPSDTDRDGVWNGLDRCPNTPANTPVTPDGCTRDTDNDGIADNLDRCANTPANARPIDASGCPVDTDRDAVFDYLDTCPNTAAGVLVDANGCPRDTDNDGVTDNLDRCANTPANARPIDASGCPVDTDRDAVFDYLDTCPNTAAGTQVDASGCPVARDADRDGVIDANDRCPNTPAAARVDANGCPLAELPAVAASLVIRNITFRAGTSRLLPTSFAELDRIAIAIVSTPNTRWEIAGHTDAQGVAAANMRLSQARAQAVMTYLASKNVPASAMTAVGYGSTRAIAPNTRAAGRAQNRRVEIKRLS
jgi:outer membrane protein OmpA-like peptidoglycan-associated protein